MTPIIIEKRSPSQLPGVIALLFGVIILLFPTLTIVTFAMIFGIAVLLGGATTIASALKVRDTGYSYKRKLTEGIIAALLGILILVQPETAAALFVTIIGIWAILLGAIFIWSFYRISKAGFSGKLSLLFGILSFIMGLILIFNPFESSRMIVVFIGIYSLVYGISMLLINRNS
ncbi:HdeD family acid-resistance protein [Alkalitalea saponilacus]|uniref:Uncharacterized membrane protein HdeD, DUF308 family n=1 Tax=Alkalitalea saponilacus TaxID=889453 RepID=A0A1T5FUX6_9BACT|nr:DUF308 domain-containing protein [Alkalitalea saponilacus]ASB49503.1 hypothetical protein CDL62_10305 [Alkalitalea saponilacus]SKB99993.1 Uncharacterized membrane protein HdeD, DUF308 family [Alkalitalea saponilacus]